MNLHHIVYGQTHQTCPIVFLNGMTQSTSHWKSQAKYFAETTKVLTYDARGQGASSLGLEPLSLELHANDLLELLERLEIEKCHLVGFSHGARIALAFASLYSDKVKSLTLCSATAIPSVRAKTIIRSWREVLTRGGLEAMAWCSLPSILGPDYLAANERMIRGMIRASVERNSSTGTTALLEAMMDYPDLSEFAVEVSCPTQVLFGSHDPLVDKAGAEELARLTKGQVFEIDSGHTIPIERPKEFQKHVEDFLATL